VPAGAYNAWPTANTHFTKPEGNLSDDFHLYELNWTPEVMETFIDGELVLSRTTDDMFATGQNYWSGVTENPWEAGEPSAPFDQEFYLILNVAVGGTNGYFPDDQCEKPWSNSASSAIN
jgi:beta-glucanase (GH16 family)